MYLQYIHSGTTFFRNSFSSFFDEISDILATAVILYASMVLILIILFVSGRNSSYDGLASFRRGGKPSCAVFDRTACPDGSSGRSW